MNKKYCIKKTFCKTFLLKNPQQTKRLIKRRRFAFHQGCVSVIYPGHVL